MTIGLLNSFVGFSFISKRYFKFRRQKRALIQVLQKIKTEAIFNKTREFQPVSNKGKLGNNIFSSSICKRQTLAIDFFHPIGNCRFFVPFSSCISTERQLCHVLITLQPCHQILQYFIKHLENSNKLASITSLSYP